MTASVADIAGYARRAVQAQDWPAVARSAEEILRRHRGGNPWDHRRCTRGGNRSWPGHDRSDRRRHGVRPAARRGNRRDRLATANPKDPAGCRLGRHPGPGWKPGHRLDARCRRAAACPCRGWSRREHRAHI